METTKYTTMASRMYPNIVCRKLESLGGWGKVREKVVKMACMNPELYYSRGSLSLQACGGGVASAFPDIPQKVSASNLQCKE